MHSMALGKGHQHNSSTNYLKKSPLSVFPQLKHKTVILHVQLYRSLGQDLGLAADPFNRVRAALQTGSCLQ